MIFWLVLKLEIISYQSYDLLKGFGFFFRGFFLKIWYIFAWWNSWVFIILFSLCTLLELNFGQTIWDKIWGAIGNFLGNNFGTLEPLVNLMRISWEHDWEHIGNKEQTKNTPSYIQPSIVVENPFTTSNGRC